MKQFVEYSLGDGGSILVEVEESEPGAGFAPAGRVGDAIQNTVRSLDEALEQVKSVGSLIITKLMTLAEAPEETSVELGFKLGTTGKAILVSTDLEGHFKITMTWKRQVVSSESH